MPTLESVRYSAYTILNQAIFEFRLDMLRAEFQAIADKNALHWGNPTVKHFHHKGIYYPPIKQAKTKMKVFPLDPKFLGEFRELQAAADKNRNEITNYHSAVVQNTSDCMVLNALIFTPTLDALRKAMGAHEFMILDRGDKVGIAETEQRIADIKEHYAETRNRIKELLFDQFFLQR